MKKVLKIILIVTSICCLHVISVSADTTTYYFNLGGGTTDATKRTLKAGGSAYERLYYVTPTHFSRKQNYKVRPYRIVTENNRPAVGGWVTIYYNNLNSGLRFSYDDSASIPANYYYFLKAEFIDGPTAQPIYVEGKYTP